MKRSLFLKSLAITITVIVFSGIFLSCQTQKYTAPVLKEISFLVPENIDIKDTKPFFENWHQAILSLENKEITINSDPWFLKKTETLHSHFFWDGDNHIFSFNPYLDEILHSADRGDQLKINQSHIMSPYYVFQRLAPDMHVLVYLPKQADKRNEIHVEFFGTKSERLTLNPTIENVHSLHILQPIAVKKINNTLYFYFYFMEMQSRGVNYGILSASYDFHTIQWNFITNNLQPAQLKSPNAFALLENDIFFNNRNFEISSINLNSKKIHNWDDLNQRINAFRNNLIQNDTKEEMISFYAQESTLVIQYIHENLNLNHEQKLNSFSSISSYSSMTIFLSDAKLIAILYHDNQSVFIETENSSDLLEIPEWYKKPNAWIYAIYSTLP